MTRRGLKLLGFLAIVIIVACAFLVIRQINTISRLTKGSVYDAVPFERKLPDSRLKFLFLGDSTAVGTGASESSQSTAGFFGRDFPNASVENISRNGLRITELAEVIKKSNFDFYDLVVIQIGANDILRFTPIKNIEDQLSDILKLSKKFGKHVVILHSGNVGTAPFFHWPFDIIMTERSRKVRAMYMRLAKLYDAYYVNLFQERDSDVFLKDIPKYYSSDQLHPSGDGYRWWYERIRKTMDDAGIVLE